MCLAHIQGVKKTSGLLSFHGIGSQRSAGASEIAPPPGYIVGCAPIGRRYNVFRQQLRRRKKK